jgi:hypothetical protein
MGDAGMNRAYQVRAANAAEGVSLKFTGELPCTYKELEAEVQAQKVRVDRNQIWDVGQLGEWRGKALLEIARAGTLEEERPYRKFLGRINEAFTYLYEGYEA